MAVGRVLCAFRLLTCFYLVVFNLNGDITRKCSSLQYRPGIVLSVCRSARLRSPVVKQSKHGTTIVALPFNTAVAMPAYFALCCDVHPNPGPTLLHHCPGSSTIVCYTRKELLQIGTLPFSTSKFMLDAGVVSQLKLHNIYNASSVCLQWVYGGLNRNAYEETSNIPVRISRRKKDIFISNEKKANLDNCICISNRSLSLHANDAAVLVENNIQSIPVRTSSRRMHKSLVNGRNSANLININVDKPSADCFAPSNFTVSVMNARSVRNKTLIIKDFVVDNNVDVLAITETWLRSGDDVIIGELIPSGYCLSECPRVGGAGGGVGLLYKKGIKMKTRLCDKFTSFEWLDATFVNLKTVRVIVVYRPPPSSANGITVGMFMDEFSALLEEVSVSTNELLIVGDFNFHMDDANNAQAVQFKNLLEMFNLKQLVTKPRFARMSASWIN